MIIDMHVHIFKEKMWSKKFLDEIYEVKRKTLTAEQFKHYSLNATTEMLLKDMDDAGVDISVALPIDCAFMTKQEPEISIWKANEYVADAQNRYPDRIIGFVGVDPQRPDSVELLEKGVSDWGLKGVKIFPGNFYPNEKRFEHFFCRVNELGVPVLFHQGADPHPYLSQYGHPMYLDELTLQHPKLKVIAAHLARGSHNFLAELMVWRPGKIWTDICAMQYEFPNSLWHFLMNIRYFMDRVPNAVLFGSDWPFCKNPPNPSHKEWVESIKNLYLPGPYLELGMKQFTESEKQKVLGMNAKELLDI